MSSLPMLFITNTPTTTTSKSKLTIMDCFGCNKKTNYKNHQYEKSLISLTSKVRLLEDEMRGIVKKKEEESKGSEKYMMVYAFREAEWKQEREMLKEEVKRLRKVVEEKEDKLREVVIVRDDEEKFVVEKENWRDEAVDKWKKLYLAIKTELDDLIQRTQGHGEASYWRIEEDRRIEELKMEVKAEEDAIDELKARLTRAEQEDHRKRREIDILRQSLRIMSTKKKSACCFIKPKLSLLRKAKKIT